MISKGFGLAMAVVVGVIIADLVIHPQGTSVLTNAAVTTEKSSLNALLGKTS